MMPWRDTHGIRCHVTDRLVELVLLAVMEAGGSVGTEREVVMCS